MDAQLPLLMHHSTAPQRAITSLIIKTWIDVAARFVIADVHTYHTHPDQHLFVTTHRDRHQFHLLTPASIPAPLPTVSLRYPTLFLGGTMRSSPLLLLPALLTLGLMGTWVRTMSAAQALNVWVRSKSRRERPPLPPAPSQQPALG